MFAFDEGRFGLKIWLRRRWCPWGKRPPVWVEDQYEWVWVYAAVEPISGASFFLLLPWVTGDCLEIFLKEFRAATGDSRIGLVLDNAPSHLSQQVQWPEGITPIPLPPYSPELNPAEQIFKHLKAKLSNRLFDSLEQLEEALTQTSQELRTSTQLLARMTGYPWWRQALHFNTLLHSVN